jgi:hypothetical protein
LLISNKVSTPPNFRIKTCKKEIDKKISTIKYPINNKKKTYYRAASTQKELQKGHTAG